MRKRRLSRAKQNRLVRRFADGLADVALHLLVRDFGGLFGLCGFEDSGHAFAGGRCRWISLILLTTTPLLWFGSNFVLMCAGSGGGSARSRWP
jgi:hypothetical protein